MFYKQKHRNRVINRKRVKEENLAVRDHRKFKLYIRNIFGNMAGLSHYLSVAALKVNGLNTLEIPVERTSHQRRRYLSLKGGENFHFDYDLV